LLHKKFFLLPVLFLLFLIATTTVSTNAVAEETAFNLKVRKIAENCRDEVGALFQKFLSSNTLSPNQLFDTFYIPVPNTFPQKYNTQYDRVTDSALRTILDKYLFQDKRLLFVIAVDKNGYLPTHNSKYSKPLTSNPDYNAKNNRTKRLFNDRTGLAAARNTKPFLLQEYSRDTGEQLADLSVPLYINGKHWGAIRIGYRNQ
jgi:methyl-accepting chemotaxis protein